MLTILTFLTRFIIGRNPIPHNDNPDHRHDLLQHELNCIHEDEVREDRKRRWRTRADLKTRDEWEEMARLKNHAEEG
jgi:hypothetical protein